MKTLIIVLIIASFLQTTIVPVDLALLILICRSFVTNEKSNLYLAFAFGLLVSHLNLSSLGIQGLIYLGAVSVTQILSKLRLAGNPLLIVPISLVFIFLNQVFNSNILTVWVIVKIILFSFLSLPVFYLVRLWEERFVVRKEIKLRV